MSGFFWFVYFPLTPCAESIARLENLQTTPQCIHQHYPQASHLLYSNPTLFCQNYDLHDSKINRIAARLRLDEKSPKDNFLKCHFVSLRFTKTNGLNRP